MSFSWNELSFHISFEPLVAGVATLSQLISWGDFPDRELEALWSEYVVVATETFANGNAFYCICGDDGQVRRIDVELEDPETFVNSDVQTFVESLLHAVQWSGGMPRASEWDHSLVDLERALATVDARAFAAATNFWPALLEHVKQSEPGSLAVTAG